MKDKQKDFWENEQVLKRRFPAHPVIEAFALPKVNKIVDVIKQSSGKIYTKDMSLLDAGAGNGYFSFYLNKYFNVTCLDFSRNILSVNPVSMKIQASAFQMPFKKSSFDVVFCGNMLHHIEDPSAVIEEMARVTSMYIAIVEPNRYNPFMLLVSLLSKEDKLVMKYTSNYLRTLVKDKLRILWQGTSGFILPNSVPIELLPFLKLIEPFMFPKIYNILIGERNDI